MRERGPKKSLYLKICADFHEFWGENKKSSSSQKMLEFSRIPGWNHKKRVFITKSEKKQLLLTNSGVITSILGVSGLELHFSGTEPVILFGAQSSLGGHNSCSGSTSSDLGRHWPGMPPWRRACCKFRAIYRTVTIAFSLKRYCSKPVLLKWELFEVTKRCPKPFSTNSFISENTI